MQVRMICFSCKTPFVIKPDEAEAGLNQMVAEDLKHYNSICPRCGKTNKVSKPQLKRGVPNWEPPKK